MLQKYFTLLIWLLVLAKVHLVQAESSPPPALDRDNARILLEISLFPDALVWPDWQFPLTLPSDATGHEKDALEALANAGILQRERQIVRENDANGSARVQGGWLYRIHPAQDALRQSDAEWLFYGRGRVLDIPQISPPVWKEPYWYLEAEMSWCVESPARWLTLDGVKQLYRARRSLESCQRPFHQSVYFQFDGRRWGYWQPQSGQPLR